MKLLHGLAALVVVAALAVADVPTMFTGKVVDVHDGDTITVQFEDEHYKIRFAGIDAPELAQPFGIKAKQVLAARILGKDVKIVWTKRDRYGRMIGDVFIREAWVNAEMIEFGWAWHYKAYSKDRDLAAHEDKAKTSKRGLWSDDQAVPPWEFRKKKNAGKE